LSFAAYRAEEEGAEGRARWNEEGRARRPALHCGSDFSGGWDYQLPAPVAPAALQPPSLTLVQVRVTALVALRLMANVLPVPLER
jgi:hypothetical protein